MAKKPTGLNPDLEQAVSDLLKLSMQDPDLSMEEKLKIIDRAINLEKLKQKQDSDLWGSGFSDPDDDA
jgi:hypothetical protein